MHSIDPTQWFWFLLRTVPGCEFLAADELRRRGNATCLPYGTMKRRRTHHSRQVLRRPAPVWGPYLMAGFKSPELPWRALIDDYRLDRLLSGFVSVTSNGYPSRVPRIEVVKLATRYGLGIFAAPDEGAGWEEDEDATRRPEVGDTVRIGTWGNGKAGARFEAFNEDPAFAAHVVTVSELQGEIAKVALTMFGLKTEASVPADRLEVVERAA